MRFVSLLLPISIASSLVLAACGAGKRSGFDDEANGNGASSDPNLPGGGTGFGPGGGGGDDPGADDRDPVTCEEAAKARSYVGCDYWPTVTGNVVPDIFDFAVVVSNIGLVPVDVRVTGPNGVDQQVSIPPASLEKIFVPWVASLKGGAQRPGQEPPPFTSSILAKKGAYHLVSSAPVVVYQFNPLEYAGKGGPSGKSWASCPELGEKGSGCFSYSNDASLLLPSTAWTGNYRLTGIHGWTVPGLGFIPERHLMGTYAAITAAHDGTVVKLGLGPKAKVVAGDGIAATDAGGLLEIALDAGDVAEVVTDKGQAFDLSGTLLQSNHPVQVISGIQCINIPRDKPACDHVEESVLPAEALGKAYVVTTPTRPKGGLGLHVVRFVGNRDGTALTYAPEKPAGCPDTLDAGQVADCAGEVGTDFIVKGTQEFSLASFMVGSTMYGDLSPKAMGDPSQTTFASIEQFRKRYLFLVPDDYDVSYAVVVGPEAAAPHMDGSPLADYTPLADGMGVWRVTMTSGPHTLTSELPVGLQAMGYGAFTSYAFPGGLNLKIIAPPPTTK
ncbi:MAG: IgGFc-binding protein [Labilithrix sp.]|nr:IgGFc-binding protein [Labilithrix sp.]